MIEVLIELTKYLEEIIINSGVFAPILSCLLILAEPFLPILPLVLFITINIIAFGNMLGYLISLLFSVIGSFLVYYLCKDKLRKWVIKKYGNKKTFKKINSFFETINFSKLTLLTAIPFLPSFVINIIAGVTNVYPRKYLAALIIGKSVVVFFWGFIGTGLIKSLKDPMILIQVGVLLLVAYILSLIVNKWLNKKEGN